MPVCMVKVIPLAAVLFWDHNFIFCLRYTLNLAKKLGLKTKRLKTNIVKEYIQKILANRTIAQLDKLFNENSDW